MNILDLAFLQLEKEFNFSWGNLNNIDWDWVWKRYTEIIETILKKYHK
ncbi:MAG: hypothetical protein WC389_10355 [Lutibacter sp.]|jgi:hypothetical protein